MDRYNKCFQKGNRKSWIVFLGFAMTIFLKNIVFHYFTFNSILISSIFNNPLQASLFYFGKLVPAIILACFVFLTKRYWWTIVISLAIDTWIMSNVFYYRANNLFVNVEAMGMTSNLAGFFDSLLALFSPVIPICYILTSIYSVFLIIFCKKSERISYKCFVVWITISFCLIIYDNYPIWRAWYADNQEEVEFDPDGYGGKGGYKFFFPFYQVYFKAGLTFSSSDWTVGYVENQSITSLFPAIYVYEIGRDKQDRLDKLTTKTSNEISHLIYPIVEQNIQKKNLIIFIVESLESWPLQDTLLRETVLPNISRLMAENSSFFCDHIESQVLHGVSSDGQLLINTGMMPIQNGAVCFLYGDNTYPNLAHFFKKSYTVNCSPGTWNQTQMTEAYGYTDLVEDKKGGHWSDEEVMDNGLNIAMDSEEPFMMQLISVASHFPFRTVRNRLELDLNMPEHMRNYLNCLSYTDGCIGKFLDNYMNTERAKRTIIVITGDHTVFKSGMLHDFHSYSETRGLSIANEKNYTPLLIVQSEPFAVHSVVGSAYQMDIFPTLLHTIGQDNYYWKGFGVNLLNENKKRVILPEKAYELSDQMIRYDYFAR